MKVSALILFVLSVTGGGAVPAAMGTTTATLYEDQHRQSSAALGFSQDAAGDITVTSSDFNVFRYLHCTSTVNGYDEFLAPGVVVASGINRRGSWFYSDDVSGTRFGSYPRAHSSKAIFVNSPIMYVWWTGSGEQGTPISLRLDYVGRTEVVDGTTMGIHVNVSVKKGTVLRIELDENRIPAAGGVKLTQTGTSTVTPSYVIVGEIPGGAPGYQTIEMGTVGHGRYYNSRSSGSVEFTIPLVPGDIMVSYQTPHSSLANLITVGNPPLMYFYRAGEVGSSRFYEYGGRYRAIEETAYSMTPTYPLSGESVAFNEFVIPNYRLPTKSGYSGAYTPT